MCQALVHFSVGHRIPSDIIFPLGYKIEIFFLQLAHFYSMNLGVTDVFTTQ